MLAVVAVNVTVLPAHIGPGKEEPRLTVGVRFALTAMVMELEETVPADKQVPPLRVRVQETTSPLTSVVLV